ncbi:Flagellum-specific peptidoglycan hydrolase FlgJ, partial [Clostridium collagenovorans DSM 3089]
MKKSNRIISLILTLIFLSTIIPTKIVQASTDFDILSEPTATVEQMKEWARKKGAKEFFIELADIYMEAYKKHGGVNPVVAYAQSAKETGYGKFGGVLDESYKNPCGLKTNSGGDDKDPNAHHRFNSWEEGISAHLDHLALYAGADSYPRKDTTDPRHSASLLGKANKVSGLEGLWATAQGYASQLNAMIVEVNNTSIPKKPSMMRVDNPTGEVEGNVEVYGWALNDAGIKEVKIYLDDKYLGSA